jgi:hypothetical protein
LLEPIGSGRVNLLVKRVAHQSLSVQPAQKRPERGHDLLHAEAVVGIRRPTQVGVNLNRADAA